MTAKESFYAILKEDLEMTEEEFLKIYALHKKMEFDKYEEEVNKIPKSKRGWFSHAFVAYLTMVEEEGILKD